VGISYAQGDADGDGKVTGLDFLRWQQEYTGVFPAVAAVPEPSIFTLAPFALLGAGFRRRRQATDFEVS
jgi:hypothetical protein